MSITLRQLKPLEIDHLLDLKMIRRSLTPRLPLSYFLLDRDQWLLAVWGFDEDQFAKLFKRFRHFFFFFYHTSQSTVLTSVFCKTSAQRGVQMRENTKIKKEGILLSTSVLYLHWSFDEALCLGVITSGFCSFNPWLKKTGIFLLSFSFYFWKWHTESLPFSAPPRLVSLSQARFLKLPDERTKNLEPPHYWRISPTRAGIKECSKLTP